MLRSVHAQLQIVHFVRTLPTVTYICAAAMSDMCATISLLCLQKDDNVELHIVTKEAFEKVSATGVCCRSQAGLVSCHWQVCITGRKGVARRGCWGGSQSECLPLSMPVVDPCMMDPCIRAAC